MDRPQQEPAKNRPNIPWIWWIIAAALLIWNIVSFLPKTRNELTVPYSGFLTQVQTGNVSEVQISGSEITGKFVKPVTGPVTGQATGAAGQPAGAGQNTTDYTYFLTTFPETTGDPELLPLLRSKDVTVNVVAPPSPIIGTLLTTVVPLLLFVGLMVWMMRRASAGQQGITNIGRSKAREYNMGYPQVTFADVAGVDEAKQDLMEVVDFLRAPDKYHQIGARIPRGVLLVGPPGTGKTLMARAIAGEAHVPFFSISASEFVEMFVGVGASRVRDLFEKAKAMSPAIVFIDELDAVGRRRGTGLGNVNDEREQTLNQLLVEMDGFDERHETIVLAATNRPDVLDPALLRPGRFDRQVTVGLPDRRGRERILQIHTGKMKLSPDVSLEAMSRATIGLSGADLANLANEAALTAARESHTEIHQTDFDLALDRIVLGEKRNLILSESDRRIIAFHESGHALVAWRTAFADAVNRVTIIPRGRALGVTEQTPGEDKYNYSQDYLLARLAVMMGGRVAEEVALGSITTGAENDLIQATRLARRMVTRWGMGSLGPVAFSTDEEQPFLGYELSQGREYSEEVAAKIDRNVQMLLEERYEYARGLIQGGRGSLDSLVDALLKEETIQQDDLTRILGERTAPEGGPEGIQVETPASPDGTG